MGDKDLFWLKFPISRRRFLQASSAAGLGAASLGLPGMSWSAEGGVLKVRDYSDISTLDPAYFIAVPEEVVMGAIYNKLVSYKPGREWGWQLEAAESMEQIDATHIKFTLRPGIMFTNGFGEMTAEDVKFSFERIIDPAMESPNKGDWGSLEGVEVTDTYSGVIVLKEAFQPLWNIALPYVVGNIISKKATEEAGGKFGNEPPCTSGPYTLKEWSPKQRTVLARNPDWNGAPAAFDEIQIFPIDDEKTAEIAFEAGDVDFTRISMSSLAQFEASPPADSTVEVFPSLYYVWVGMNMDNPKLQDPNVRKAIQLAIDVPSVVEAAYFGAAEPSTGIVAPGLVGHREQSLIPPEANMAEAKRLLAEAGLDGGLDLTLDILNKSTNVTAAQVMQAVMAEAGINLEIRLNESGSFWTLGDEKSGDRWKDIELVLNRFSMTPDPYYATQWFIQDQVGIWNWERFRSDEFDKLNLEGVSEQDDAKRAQIYQRMQDLMEESGAYRFITHESSPVAFHNSIVPALRPDGLPLLRYFAQS